LNLEDTGVPPKVTVNNLRNHFKTVYRLADDQIDIMLESSAKSLNTSLSALYDAIGEGASLEEVSRLGHSIKGLLLNMGEQGWAELARELELSASGGADVDYKGLIDGIHKGVEDIL